MPKRKYVVRIKRDKTGRYIIIKGKKYRLYDTKKRKRVAKAIVKKLKRSFDFKPASKVSWKTERPQAIEDAVIETKDGKVVIKPKTRTIKESDAQKKVQEQERKEEEKFWRWQAKEAGMKIKKGWDLETIIEKLDKFIKKGEADIQSENTEREQRIAFLAEMKGRPVEDFEDWTKKELDQGWSSRDEAKQKQRGENIAILSFSTGRPVSDFTDWSTKEIEQRVEALQEEELAQPSVVEAQPPGPIPPEKKPRKNRVIPDDPLKIHPGRQYRGVPIEEKKIEAVKPDGAMASQPEVKKDETETTTGGGKPMSDKGLSNIQIDEIMQKYPEYLGCIAHDEISSRILPKIRPRSRGCFVINTKPSSHRGEHWQCVYFDARPAGDNTMEFFDSYGDPADETILRGLKHISEKLDAKTYLKFKENRVEKQGDSNNCGFFCTQFLIDRLRGKPFIDASGWKDVYGGEREVEKFKSQVGFGYMPSFGEQTGGLFGIDLGNALSNTVSAVRNVFYPSSKMPASSKAVLDRYGRSNISRIQIRRAPVASAVEKFLNVISLGQYEKGKAEANFDKMFHLGIVFHLFTGPKILAEKNETINITTSFSDTSDTQYMDVPLRTRDLTLNVIMAKTEAYMSTFKFYQYNAFSNNCQDWIMGILNANGLNTPTIQAFVKQPVDSIVKRLPSFVGKTAQFATDTWARIKQAFGRGRKITKNKFRKVMTEFKQGKLRSSSGDLVTNPKQALAIAYSESRHFSEK
jgi:hypothetical protein